MTQYDGSAAGEFVVGVYQQIDYFIFEEENFFRVLGNVEGKTVFDLACGDGRYTRKMRDKGAIAIGSDLSPDLITKAREKEGSQGITFLVADATDPTFKLSEPVDVVTAMYLLHYSENRAAMLNMCKFIARNLKPKGRFVTYAINPDYKLDQKDFNMEKHFGFFLKRVNRKDAEANKMEFCMGNFVAEFWHWPKDMHEQCLKEAGFKNITWTPFVVPPQLASKAKDWEWYLNNSHCVMLTAEKE